ncbi:MAG: hypothetical protein LBB47_01715 [Spirochaetaceae bacterium]|nr:hypothetical protein [Spirochaetaceae bacterium]
MPDTYVLEDFSSQHWFPRMKVYAREFVDRLNDQGIDGVGLDGFRFDRIIHYYYAYMIDYKQKTYVDRAENENIDHHKIIALYIKAILAAEPFVCGEGSKTTRYSLPANESFCLIFAEVVFRSWEKDCASKNLLIDDSEKRWLLIILYQYKKYPGSLNIISLSQLIYYIEKCFFK